VIVCLMEEPETQVAGIVVIPDLKNLSMDVVSMFPIRDLLAFYKVSEVSSPVRLKQILVVNMPKIAVATAQLARSVLNKKMNSRLTISSNDDCLKEYFDQKILPRELGGVTSVKEMLEDFKVLAKAQSENIRLIASQTIDLSKVKSFKFDEIESFRKLEID
jgi:CRAL/TRIO domain